MLRVVWVVLLVSAVQSANQTTTTPASRQHLNPEDMGDPSDMREEALSGWVRISNQFLESVLDPHQTINTTVSWLLTALQKGSFSIQLLLQAWKSYATFGFCVVFGFVYTAVMFLVLILFPILRMRGKCGGRKEQEKYGSTGCRVEGILLFAVVVILLTSVSAMFLIDNQLSVFSNNAPGPKRVISALVQDSSTYVNQTVLVLIDVVSPALDEARELADSMVQDIGVTLTINAVSRVPVFIDAVTRGMSFWKPAFDSTAEVGNAAVAAVKSLQEFQTALSEWKMENCTNANCSEAVVPESGDWLPQLDSVQDLATKVKALGESLAEAVHHGLLRLEKSIIDVHRVVLERVDNLIEEFRNIMQKIPSQVSAKLNDVLSYTDVVIARQEAPRKAITTGVSLAVLLITVQLLLGLVLGCCQYTANNEPHLRSSSSHFAGWLLMATVYVMIFLAPFFMLITTHLFMIGGLVQSYVCVPLHEPDSKLVDQVWERVAESGMVNLTGSPLEVFRPSVFLRRCQDDASLLRALDLESAEALADKFDMQSEAGIEEKLGNGFLPTDLRDRSDELRRSIDGLPPVIKSLQANHEAAVDFKSRVEGIPETLPTEGLRNSLRNLILGSSLPGALDRLADSQKRLQERLNSTIVQTNLPKLVTALAEDESEFWDEIIVQPVDEGISTMKNKTVALINATIDKLQGHGCKPVSTVVRRVGTLLCKVIVEPVNGFWFGLGAAVVLFVPAIVLATKLSKHYYKMQTPWLLPRSREAKLVEEVTMESFKGKEHRQW